MVRNSDESIPNQDTQREEFILFVTEMLCMIGSLAIIWIGFDNRDIIPYSMLISISITSLLFGFIFDRGAINSQMPSIFRERIWWLGPLFFLGFMFVEFLFGGSLLLMTLVEVGQLLLILGFWIIGVGLKRVLVQGKFDEAYRGMVARTGEKRFQLNRGLLGITMAFVVIINLLVFVFKPEDIVDVLPSSLLFLIITNVCIGYETRKRSEQWAEPTESDEYDYF